MEPRQVIRVVDTQPRQVIRVVQSWNRTFSEPMPAYVLRSDQKVISGSYIIGSGNHEELVLIIEEDVPTPRVEDLPEDDKCSSCHGTKTISVPWTHPTNPNLDSWRSEICGACNGRGTAKP